jgi:hypothetical protein
LRLIRLFGLPSGTGPRSLYAALHRIEARAHRYAERVCNGDIDPTDAQVEAHDVLVLRSVRRLIGDAVPVEVNGDPRGYALKIPDEWMRAHPDVDLYRDMGGYGIICPDFS